MKIPKLDLIENPNFIPLISMIMLFGTMFFLGYVPEAFRFILFAVSYLSVIALMLLSDVYARVIVSQWKHIAVAIRLADGRKLRRHLYISPETQSANIQEHALKGMKGWYSFLLEFVKAVDIPGYSGMKRAMFLSRGTFDETFDFRPCRNWAAWLGQIVNHPSGEASTLYLYPHPHNLFQETIPVMFVAEAGGKEYFPRLIENWKTDLPDSVVATAKERDLQERIVGMEYENTTLREQLKGLTTHPLTVDKAVTERVIGIATYQDDIRKAVTPERRFNVNLTWLLVAGIVGFVFVYFYMNPSAGAALQSYMMTYTPHIVLILVIALLIIIFLRRGKGK